MALIEWPFESFFMKIAAGFPFSTDIPQQNPLLVMIKSHKNE